MDNKGIKLEKLIEYGSKEAVIQNLKDAGCTPDVIKCCIACMEQGKKNGIAEKTRRTQKGSFEQNT